MLSYIAPLLMAATAFALPSGSYSGGKDAPSCMDVGTKVTGWKVVDFDYHASYTFSSPSHQNSWGYVNFTLSNPALDYQPRCTAASSQLTDFFYADVEYTCDVPAKHSGDSASFKFNRPTGQIDISQSWSCVKEGGRIMADGDAKLKLDCKEKTWQNKHWKVGQIYSQRTVTCKKVTAKVPVKTISAVL